MSKEVLLINSNKKAIVDDRDYEAAREFTWMLDEQTGYAFRITNDDGSCIEYMHDWVLKRAAALN